MMVRIVLAAALLALVPISGASAYRPGYSYCVPYRGATAWRLDPYLRRALYQRYRLGQRAGAR